MKNGENIGEAILPILALLIFFSSYIWWFLNRALNISALTSFTISLVLISICTITIILFKRRLS